jgi:hypothetical protein
MVMTLSETLGPRFAGTGGSTLSDHLSPPKREKNKKTPA